MTTSNIHGVSVINSDLFEDNRGAFESSWENHKPFSADHSFKPSSANFSYNTQKFTLRGMHFQVSPFQQTKLVTCVHGKLLDVVVDLRKKPLAPVTNTFIIWITLARACLFLIKWGCQLANEWQSLDLSNSAPANAQAYTAPQ